MLDINKIRENKEEIKKSLLKRMREEDLNLDEILEIDDKRKEIIQSVELLKAERNKYSQTKPSEETIKKMRDVSDEIKKIDDELNKTEETLKEKLSKIPNIVADDVVAGGEENNKVIKEFGEKPVFDFEPKDHIELATSLGMVDYKRAAKMSGSGFWCYTGIGASLEWALISYFIDFHRSNGYKFIIPPYLLTEESAYTSGHLPKFRDDLFWTEDGKLCLNATAEMMMGNYHKDEILNEKDLPMKYFAFAPSFRKEVGSYRKEERGMIRGHQFHKVEMFIFSSPDNSWDIFDELVKNAEKLVEGLGLHYQSSQLAAGDASSTMAKTIDIEVWIPSMNVYKEVSSVSNALDYQSRRGNIRYRNSKSGKNEFVHMLNGSGLATSRLIPAILEQFQQSDGSIRIPDVLKKYMGSDF